MNVADAYAKSHVSTLLLSKTDDAEVYEAIAPKTNTSDTFTKVQTAIFWDAKADKTTANAFLHSKADATTVYAYVHRKHKLAGATQLDDVLNLLQLAEITGGHTADLPGKPSATWFSKRFKHPNTCQSRPEFCWNESNNFANKR